MARFSDKDPMTALAGAEIIPGTQSGLDGRTTTQAIANLSGAPAATVEFASDADLTLTQAQYQAESITFTDSPTTLTAARAVTFPSHFPTKWVQNNTAQTLTLKKSGQTGVALAAGAYAIVASGASDVVVGPGVGLALPSDIIVALGDESTAITTGTAKVTIRAPRAMTLSKVKASLTGSSSSGLPQFDVKKNGTTIFSTKPTIDVGEKTTETAATPAVLSTTAIAADDELTFDIVTAGTGATGAKITLVATSP